MALVACDIVGTFGPNLIAVVLDADGKAVELVVDRSSVSRLKDGCQAVDLGIVGQDADRVLVEFPQEAASGAWRAWVPSGSFRWHEC
jgi:hypothetical protein